MFNEEFLTDHFCLKNEIDKILKTDEKTKNLLKKLGYKFSPDKHLEYISHCQSSENGKLKIPAYYSGESIVFCEDNITGYMRDQLDVLLRHELTHLYDEKVLKLNLLDQEKDLKISEMRAYKYSGYCDFSNRLQRGQFLNSERECLAIMTMNSLSCVAGKVFDKDQQVNIKLELDEIYNSKGFMKDLEMD